ncbi:MAG: amidohydrolase [Acidobacteriota bacterium]
MLRLIALALLFLAPAAGLGCLVTPIEPADLVLLNGKVVTLDPERPEAEAVAVLGGVIVATGTTEEIRRRVGSETTVIDLDGRLATPGLIESHAHLSGLGEARLSLDLSQARSWSEIVDLVAEAASKRPAGEWIVGRGWHQEKWDAPPDPSFQGLPLHDSLSERTPDNPVLLVHASGHACIANRRAMEQAGVTTATPDPEGGRILRNASGRITGVFQEAAQDLIRRALDRTLAERSEEEAAAHRRRIVELAARECLSKGICTFHDAGTSFEYLETLKELAADGELPLRLYCMLGEPDERLADRLASLKLIGFGHDHLTVRAIKRYADGALGSRGAWLLEPYSDLSSSLGLPTEEFTELRHSAELAAQNGFQLCTHAIGDRANREVLDIYEAAAARYPAVAGARWRIEHAQHLDPQDIPRFHLLGVVAAMQAVHATSDGPWVVSRIGEERARRGAYVWRSLLDTGAVICNGTDAPVEDVDPIPSFYAAVTRRTKQGEPFFPEQCMTREEALRSYTLAGAYAAFEEGLKGSLEPGKLGDITVFSRDLLTVPEAEILGTRVDYTIVGGRVLYQR